MMKSLRSSVLYILVATVFLFSCTKVDYELGREMIPESGKMFVETGTIGSIKYATVKIDSIESDKWGYVLLGSAVDPIWGRTTTSGIVQLLPSIVSFTSRDTLFGVDPTIDSVFLELSLTDFIGDTNYVQTVEIFDLTKVLPKGSYDSTYFSNFDPKDIISQSPVATFDLSAKVTKYKLPKEVANKYLDTLDRVYEVDSLFLNKFPGIYLRVKNEASNGGFITRVVNEYSNMIIHYHNKNAVKDGGPDTTYMSMIFSNTFSRRNKAISMIKNDFSLADPVIGVNNSVLNAGSVPFDQMVASDVTYVRSMAGLMTRMEIPKSEVDRIMSYAKSLGYSRVAINNATLWSPLKVTDNTSYDKAIPRLGMYYNYQEDITIPDYWYGIDDTKYPFGGLLSRSLGQYSMNITSYVQELFSGKTDKYGVDISSAYDYESSLRGVFLNGSMSEKPINITITYTLLK